jgi:hypothetical protein
VADGTTLSLLRGPSGRSGRGLFFWLDSSLSDIATPRNGKPARCIGWIDGLREQFMGWAISDAE